MTHPLFFIPLIADALAAKDPKKALKQALNTIHTRCQEHPDRPGCDQYRQFMQAILEQWSLQHKITPQMAWDYARDIALNLATGQFETDRLTTQTARTLIHSDPPLRDLCIDLQAELAALDRDQFPLNLLILKDGQTLSRWPLVSFSSPMKLTPVAPGHYTFELSTGREIGDLTLTARDLLWSEAFPEQDLPLAAAMDDTPPDPTRKVDLLDGKLTITVFPGIESGWIEIELN